MKSIINKLKHNLKKHPKIYSISLYSNVVINKFKRFVKYGGNAAFAHKISKRQRKNQVSHTFEKNIKFSILVPLYNTPKKFLKEMIVSVKHQTYGNWELCLADGSDCEHRYVEEYCLKAAAADARIKYKKLIKNGGISENTNECIEMSSGEYLALFDHDDVLHPSALFECMKVICEQNADFVYTDEATFLGKNKSNIISFHFKPDFAPDNLLANNYICHFSVFKASLVDRVGMFRKEYDGSQDHDMILRLTDAAQKIVHIPRLLYFWRSHANSVAMDISSKTYAINAGRAAVCNFLESKGVNATVESSPAFPTIYKINYEIIGEPKVSIIIPDNVSLKKLENCLQSIITKSTYKNYEIIIVAAEDDERVYPVYYKKIRHIDNKKIYYYDKPFNRAAMNGYAVDKADGEYLLFLDASAQVQTPDWIEQLLMYAQRADVGAVGAKLYKDDETIWHGGIILGLGEHKAAGLAHYGADKSTLGYMGKLFYAQNVSAVTSCCMMVKKADYSLVGGFEQSFVSAFCDADFCLKLRQKNLLNIFSAFCVLNIEEPKVSVYDKRAKLLLTKQAEAFKEKWDEVLKRADPYYNPNFSLENSYIYDFKKYK